MTDDDSDQAADEQRNIEQRVQDLEDEVNGLDVHDLEERLAAIERQQQRLEEHIEAIAERTRKESELTPHIDTVEELYHSLADIESYMTDVHEQLDDLRSEIEEDTE